MNAIKPTDPSTRLSFVIPAMNEEATIKTLFAGISQAVEALEHPYEVIFLDDGSTDRTWQEMSNLADEFPQVTAVRLQANFGKARALHEGFSRAKGDIVFTMDADLQDDPREIPNFLAKLAEGYDLVSGYKKVRHDPWHKVLPSRVFNRMISKLNGVYLHDHNCGFKAYRAEVLKGLSLYGEMHRMIPSLASMRGFKSAEVVVQHHPRRYGQSKYGIKRFARGFMDLLTTSFLKNYRERPLHLFGGVAVSCVALALITILGAAGLAFYSVTTGISLAILGFIILAAGAMSFGIGLQCELLISGRHASGETVPVRETVPSKRAPMEVKTSHGVLKPFRTQIFETYNI